MCGILSVINLDGRTVDEKLLVRMRDIMRHRGPNDAGLFIDGPVGLAHRRLSIIDLSEKGHQPMPNENGSLVLVFNGEIYNYVELREDLLKKGHRFRSGSDSEVILHQYEEDGERCLEKFNGMFAFALWDKKKKRLFAARDRMGIKPLYFYRDTRRFILASEIKSILEDPSVERVPDYEGISDYLFAGRALGGKTLFKNIRELEAGYLLEFKMKGHTLEEKKYWDVQFNYKRDRSIEEVEEEVFFLLDDAVRIHCRSDAPLGCHLSGGLDSSTVAALTSRHRKAVKAFSIKFTDDPNVDETGYARMVAEHIACRYVESMQPAKDLAELLPHLVWQMDQPMVSDGAVGYYYVNYSAREHVRVTMTGHGGDEVFAGYPAQFQAAFGRMDMFDLYIDHDRFREQVSIKNRFLKALLVKGPSGVFSSLLNKLQKKEPTLEQRWATMHCGLLPGQDCRLNEDFIKELKGYSPFNDYIGPFREAGTDEILDRCLYHDLRVYLPSLLHLEDRASMAVSLESRLPLLDTRLVEFLATVTPEQKVDGLVPKYLLRNAASRLIPDEVWKRRDKKPFPLPVKALFTPEMQEMKKKLLLSRESLGRGIFSKNALKDAVTDVDAWPVINLELWFRIFIDRDPFWLKKTGPDTTEARY